MGEDPVAGGSRLTLPRVDPTTSEGRKVDGLTIVQYWDSDEVPEYLTSELATFTDLNSDFRHLLFSRAAAEEFIAEHFTPREVAAFRCCAVAAMQADYLRFCAGLVFAGIYVDADVRCVTPLRKIVPAPGGIRLFHGRHGNVINGLFAFHAPGHPFLELALEIATANIERRFPDRVYFATGPPIFTALVALHRTRSTDGSLPGIEDRLLQEATRVYWETIGDPTRVTAAMKGVEVRPTEEYRACVRSAGPLPYKSTDAHWVNAKDIFHVR